MNLQLRHQLIWSLYAPSALIAFAHAMLIPVLPVYGNNLTTSYALIGILLAAEALGRVFGDLPSGNLLRRYGMKKTMLLGLAVAAGAMLMMTFVNNIWSASLLLLISGIGHAFYNITRHAYIAAIVPLEIRGRAIGLFGGVFRIGKFGGPILGGWIGGTFALQGVFPVFVILLGLTALFVWIFMVDPPLEKPIKRVKGQPSLLLQTFQENRGILMWAGLGQIFAQLTRNGWMVIIPLYAANILNIPVETIGIIVGIGSAFDMLFFYLAGVLMDRFGRKWAIVPSFAIQGLGIGLILAATNVYTLTLVASLIGLANALSSGTMMTLGSDLAPRDVRGEFLSIWRMIGDAGFVAGPIVVGSIAQILALQISIISVAGAGLGTAVLFALLVPETLQKRTQAVQLPSSS